MGTHAKPSVKDPFGGPTGVTRLKTRGSLVALRRRLSPGLPLSRPLGEGSCDRASFRLCTRSAFGRRPSVERVTIRKFTYLHRRCAARKRYSGHEMLHGQELMIGMV